MQIAHIIDDFLFDLFYVHNNDIEQLRKNLETYYTIGGEKPEINIEGNIAYVNIDFNAVDKEVRKFSTLIKLAESGKKADAYELAKELAISSPSNSEVHRIKGQLESDLGDSDKAIDSLIDALRWDPENTYALIMMGNIFARDKNDVETAMKYYQKASQSDKTDNISLNNIGGNLLMLGKLDEALEYLEKADDINDNYPNTKYGLAEIYLRKGDFTNALYYVTEVFKKVSRRDPLFDQAFALLNRLSSAVAKLPESQKILRDYIEQLKQLTGKNIIIEEASDIPTAAKVEFAENHNRDYHLIRYNPKYSNYLHLILHELVHIEFAETARLAGDNKLFISTKDHKVKFMTDYEKYGLKLLNKGYREEAIANVLNNLFEGLNRQIFNAPIDLFIEDKLFKAYPSLRSVQLCSLLTLLFEGIEAVTKKEIVALIDPKILSNSKIYNITQSLFIYNNFYIDFEKYFKATKDEIMRASNFYAEFLEYMDDRQPGEEYELVQNWADDLNLGKYFNLVPESEYDRSSPSSKLDFLASEIDENEQANRDLLMHEFQESHKDTDINPAVMMFMVGALKYFKDKSPMDIKMIAFQIATIGGNGIHPAAKSGYKVPGIPGSDFSGYQMLAYYYVSWALSAPQVLPELQLPFDKEYEAAKSFFKD